MLQEKNEKNNDIFVFIKDKLLKKGDILNIDVTSIIDGWHGDTSRMFKVNEISVKAQNLMKDLIFDAQFDKAVIASNDLNYFYNEFGKDNKFYIDTHLIGTLNNFTTHNLKLVDKFHSEITGNVNFKYLFDKF